MNRRELLQRSAAWSLAGPLLAGSAAAARAAPSTAPLRAPPQGPIPVGVLLSAGAVVIDFCGPWEVFSNVALPDGAPAFRLYTVGAATDPLRASGGLQVVPDFTFADAPAPRVVVIPAQQGADAAALAWLRRVSGSSDLLMSVCTGAFVLARTGLLAGKPATTHHSAYTELAMKFPEIQVQRGARFVDAGNLASAGGLSSGIDLALHVVERYFGRETARQTADYMEYQGQGWLDANANAAYRAHRVAAPGQALCAVCEMDVDPRQAPRSSWQGTTYYFCMPEHKAAFDAAPAGYVAALHS
jgi:putative intracellular protease/amidase/YHS domain-containing protein